MPTDPSHEPTTIDRGRLRVCDGLIVSVNRSWQVDVEPGERPVAPFKAMAPIASANRPAEAADEPADEHPDAGVSGEVYLAAVAPHEAFWFGFESEAGRTYAVTIDLDGRNAFTLRDGPAPGLDVAPRNFLVVPDQPWFDAITDRDGAHRQLVPTGTVGPQVVLGVHRLEPGAVAAPSEPDGPVPHYTADATGSTADPQPHRWAARSITGDVAQMPRCATVVIDIVEPSRFEALTGTELESGVFDDAGTEPPAPFDPFAGP